MHSKGRRTTPRLVESGDLEQGRSLDKIVLIKEQQLRPEVRADTADIKIREQETVSTSQSDAVPDAIFRVVTTVF